MTTNEMPKAFKNEIAWNCEEIHRTDNAIYVPDSIHDDGYVLQAHEVLAQMKWIHSQIKPLIGKHQQIVLPQQLWTIVKEIENKYPEIGERLGHHIWNKNHLKEFQTPQASKDDSLDVFPSREENSAEGLIGNIGGNTREVENRKESLHQATKIVGSKKPDDSFCNNDYCACGYEEASNDIPPKYDEEKPKLVRNTHFSYGCPKCLQETVGYLCNPNPKATKGYCTFCKEEVDYFENVERYSDSYTKESVDALVKWYGKELFEANRDKSVEFAKMIRDSKEGRLR